MPNNNKLPVTVPTMLHEDMAEALGEPYAISYLCGAVVSGRTLRARTSIAAERLNANPVALEVIRRHGLSLGESLAPHEREALPSVTPPTGIYRTAKTWKPKSPISAEERQQVGELMRGLAKRIRANRMDFKQLARRPGENEIQQAERLWPNHRVDRMRG